MQNYIKKYVIFASVVTIIWVLFLGYRYTRSMERSDILKDEIQVYAMHTAQQAVGILNWFEQKQQVFVPEISSELQSFIPGTRILTGDGQTFSMPIPIALAKSIESKVQDGVNIRFVSNNPLNNNNLPSADDNRALMEIVEFNTKDHFSFRENAGYYHYVRPLLATTSCLTCHTNVLENGLIGALVIDINPVLFVHSKRMNNINMRYMGILGSASIIILFYLLLLNIWRRQKNITNNTEHAQTMVANMSQEIELVLGNMNHILNDLKQDESNPHRTELLRALESINKDLLDTSFKLQAGEHKIDNSEEVFHVEDFFNQCTHIFYPQCQEKNLSLTVAVDISVPTYLLGDTYHLRQALGRLIKYSVLYTNRGSVNIKVRSAVDMPSRFNMHDLNHLPIHLIIEVEDTGIGFVVTDKQNLLQSFAASTSRGKTLNTRPIISLSPVNEIAARLNGGVSLLRNSKNGACFKLVVQMKLVDSETDVKAHDQSRTVEKVQMALDVSDLQDIQLVPTKSNTLEVVTSNTINKMEKPTSIILGNSEFDSMPSQAQEVFDQANLTVSHMTTGDAILKTIDNPNHGYSAILLRHVSDMDIYYLATRIRYIESENAEPVSIVIMSDTTVQTDLHVMRHFNVSTADYIPRDPHMVLKITRLALHTKQSKIFQCGKLFDKTPTEEDANKIFNMHKALENAKNDRKLLHSICAMWVRFYPGQIERLDTIMQENNREDLLRLLRSIKNSANTVCLPMLWTEANRLENEILSDNEVRYEKLLSVYDITYQYMNTRFGTNKGTKSEKS